jgi:hypothetical protein
VAREAGALLQPVPSQAAAGAQLNALLCATLTGQTALELRRADQPPVRMELQREPDGRGGFRIARIRLRHQAEDGFLEATAEVALGAGAGTEAGPLSVDIDCSESWKSAVVGQLATLHEALDARGLAPTVRARAVRSS